MSEEKKYYYNAPDGKRYQFKDKESHLKFEEFRKWLGMMIVIHDAADVDIRNKSLGEFFSGPDSSSRNFVI